MNTKGFLRLPLRVLFPVVCVATLLFCSDAGAAIQLNTIARGLSAPVGVVSARDGSGRLFVIEQAGRIRVLSGGALLNVPFLDIADRVVSGGELGLLGLAFHPNYPANGRFFVNYTRTTTNGLETVIAEYSLSSTNVNAASRDSERIVLRFSQPFDNHNGGMLAFGPDGFLYIATGDGGSGGDPFGNGQNLNTLLGKILRIDVDSAIPYAVPRDNPFVGRQARGEIWAYGLRNPWRFSFDRLTGRLFAADVGQDLWEEIDIIVEGGNYGWNIMEGAHCFAPPVGCNASGLIPPINEYGHDLGDAVIGGYVYRGSRSVSLWGKYIFGDSGSGRLWSLTEIAPGQWRRDDLIDSRLSITSFGEDENGGLYLVDYAGTVRQIVDSEAPQSSITVSGVVNAASYLSTSIAPGEIISIFGSGLGPSQPAYAQLNSAGVIDNFLAGIQVLFDGIPAPLYYVQANQINAQVPYGVAGKSSTAIEVRYNGSVSAAVNVPVAPTAPAIFATSGGTGQAALLNQNLSPNSPSNPAVRGSVVTLFATGEGQTSPPGIDGKPSAALYPTPILAPSVMIGGFPAEVQFAGSAPGFAGLLQINAKVPALVAPGSSVAVVLTIGGRSSQPGITMAVQ